MREVILFASTLAGTAFPDRPSFYSLSPAGRGMRDEGWTFEGQAPCVKLSPRVAGAKHGRKKHHIISVDTSGRSKEAHVYLSVQVSSTETRDPCDAECPEP
jgi:hypothetical protein